MKKTKITIALAGLMIAGAAIVSSCKKSTTTPADTNASTAKDNATAEQNSNDAENIGAQANENGSLSTFRLAGGGLGNILGANDTVTHVAGSGVYTVTFNNFVGTDGHTRNGTIVFSVNPAGAHYRDANMVMTVSTPGNTYMVDGNTVEISKTITNNGIVSGNMQWTIVSNLTIVKASGGGTFTWSANRTHALLNTSATTFDGTSYAAVYSSTINTSGPYNGTTTPINWPEAIIQINGTSSGTDVDGTTFTASATNVVRNMNCAPFPLRPHFHPFCAGTVDFSPAGKTTRVINYGTGSCSTTYTITIGSVTETFTW
jgi:hypothetical protein